MAKYIDAERLKAEIERRKQSLRAGICSDDAFTKEQKKEMLVASEEIDRFNRIIDSLQQEQDLIVINKKVWEAQEQFRKNKDFGKPLQQEQPHWVPSKEQMKAIESCFCEFGEGYPDEDGLRSLYNDLKKLM